MDLQYAVAGVVKLVEWVKSGAGAAHSKMFCGDGEIEDERGDYFRG